MWVVRIRRCLRRSSTCERWVGVHGGVVSWCFVCLCGFARFSGWVVVGCGLFWLIHGLLGCLCGGFALLVWVVAACVCLI